MRWQLLPLLLALCAAGAIAAAAAAGTSKPKTSETKQKLEQATTQGTKKPATSSSASTTRQSKALKTAAVPGENRGKRTLYDFGNAGFLYPEVASRRAGFVDSYYPQSGYYNGQQAIAQYPAYSPYPQYLEAPEPIIEIIIKDANETLPEEPAQPIVSKKKKKKEKVHVFYVNYKKDQNNKLHLESPIASLNNDDNDEPEEEEEEEIIQYPVTSAPPLKSTTLRTIIHPDSEKYHSNSGIHVSFGAENKHQTGHILEEHDAESVQRPLVALPLTNTRADYGRENSFSNLLFGSNPYQSQQQQQQFHYASQQQLPAQHSSNYFRSPSAKAPQQQQQQQQQPQQQHFSTQFYQKQQHQQSQQQQQQQQVQPQQQHVPRPSITQQQLPSTSSQTIFNKLVQQSQFYVNHNQQYQQPQQQHSSQQQQHSSQQHQHSSQQQQHSSQQQQHSSQQQQQYQKPPHKQQQVPFFPTIPPKLHASPSATPYQPVKFRPTPAPAPQVKPLQLPQQQQQHQQQQHQQQQYQSQQQPKPQAPAQPYQFIRQPQFVQHPQFIVHSPTPATDYYQQQPQQSQQQQQQQSQQQQQHQSQQQHKFSSPALNYFDIKPSKETELLKSIPKYEQHITETIHNSQLQQFGYSSSNRNEVIHDIPAPNLAPVLPTIPQPQAQLLSGHYITASAPNVAQQQQQQQQQTPPPVYAESTHGQKVMVVTPVPPTYQQQQQQQYLQPSSESLVQLVHPQPQSQALTSTGSFGVDPRQKTSAQYSSSGPTDNSPFSVSTFHSDVFKELQQRQQQEQQQQHQQQQHYAAAPVAAPAPAPAPVPTPASSPAPLPTAASKPNPKASQTLLQLPDEVPDDLRQQLFSSGILNNADISILDYDKQGDIALENLPAEHLQHFYGAGGGAQIAETNKVLTVVKPNGDKVALSEKQIDRVKQSNSLPQKQNLDVKVVRYEPGQGQSISEKYLRADATVVTPVELNERAGQQYNRYLPLKINGAQFPIPDSEELLGKKIVSVVVLAPVEAQPQGQSVEARSSVDSKEVKFLGGELVKTLVKKPSKENFRRWLEKESRTDIELQSVVLLVAKSSESAEQEIFMYDIATGAVNKLNGELSSTFVNVAEENASSEDLEHAATLDPSSLESMMHLRRR